ncbi:unnamed protein product, partial [marine sediment metagenome]
TDLTSRKRVETTLNHREPDRVPFDLGGSILTGIHEQAYRRLRAYLGLPAVEVEIEDAFQRLAKVDKDVKDRLEVDVYGINPGPPRGFEMPQWSEDGYDKFRDEWGIEWWRPQDGGLYYDMRVHPLADIDTVGELSRVTFPDPLDPGRYEGIAEQADHLMNTRRVATILGRNAPGILEIALWTRGPETYYCDLLVNRPFAEGLLDVVLENKMKYWAHVLERVGENVMMVSEADDLCTQAGMLISPELYRDLIKPRHARLFEHIRTHAAV